MAGCGYGVQECACMSCMCAYVCVCVCVCVCWRAYAISVIQVQRLPLPATSLTTRQGAQLLGFVCQTTHGTFVLMLAACPLTGKQESLTPHTCARVCWLGGVCRDKSVARVAAGARDPRVGGIRARHIPHTVGNRCACCMYGV